jgi:hypothetical protein
MVLLDRSWYHRAGVERVMGFCTEEEVEESFRTVPAFERMLVARASFSSSTGSPSRTTNSTCGSRCDFTTRSSSGS